MAIANVALTNTFDQWRIVTNQMVNLLNDIDSSANLVRAQSNTTPLVVTSSVSRGGIFYFDLSTNSFFTNTSTNVLATSNAVNQLYVIIESNAANTLNISIAANTYANAIGIAANTYANAVGEGANANLSIATIAANVYALSVAVEGSDAANAYSRVFANSVGIAANAYSRVFANSVGIAANAYSRVFANTVGVSGNAYALSVASGGSDAANAYSRVFANTVGVSGNAYTNTVVVANLEIANAYTRTFANTKLANTSGATFNGDLYFPTGNVGVGRTDAVYAIDVVGTVNASAVLVNGSAITGGSTLANEAASSSTFYPVFTQNTSGLMTSANVSSTKLYFIPSTGTFSATEFNSLSDVSAKTDIQPITNALDIINNIEGVGFRWKDSGRPSFGVIAQQMEKYIPALVDSTNENKTVNYDGIIAFLIEAIKELNAKLENK